MDKYHKRKLIKKNQIIEAAARVFARNGYTHAVVADIALEANIMRCVLSDDGWEPGIAEIEGILDELLPLLRASGVTLAIENDSNSAYETSTETEQGAVQRTRTSPASRVKLTVTSRSRTSSTTSVNAYPSVSSR